MMSLNQKLGSSRAAGPGNPARPGVLPCYGGPLPHTLQYYMQLTRVTHDVLHSDRDDVNRRPLYPAQSNFGRYLSIALFLLHCY